MTTVDAMIKSENWMFAQGYTGDEHVSHTSGFRPKPINVSIEHAAMFNLHPPIIRGKTTTTPEEYYEEIEI